MATKTASALSAIHTSPRTKLKPIGKQTEEPDNTTTTVNGNVSSTSPPQTGSSPTRSSSPTRKGQLESAKSLPAPVSPIGRKSLSSVGMFNDNLYSYSTLQNVNVPGVSNNSNNAALEATLFSATPKQNHCIEMLTRGFVHSFVDFFYLTHQEEIEKQENPTKTTNILLTTQVKVTDRNKSPRTGLPDENPLFNLGEATLRELKENLTLAEASLRQGTYSSFFGNRSGDAKSVITAYENLAEHFEILGNLPIAIHFFQKCLDVAQQMNDLKAEGKANAHLGEVYEKMDGDILKAIQYYEEFLRLSKKSGNYDDISSAGKRLVGAYKNFADQCEANEDYIQQAVYLQKCLEMAQLCNDVVSEGVSHHKLGLAYKLLNRTELHIQHLQLYLDICRKTNDEVGEGIACAALATAFKDSNNSEMSIRYLQENIDLAMKTNQAKTRAEACCSLGVIFNKEGDYEKAVEQFEQFFEVAKSLEDKKLIDQARVYLGIAKGNLALQNKGKLSSRNNSTMS